MEEMNKTENTISKVSTTGIGWSEGTEQDFAELHEAIKNSNTGKNKYSGPDESDESSTSEEDDSEPPENQPGLRFLWAAQHGKEDLVEILLQSDTKLIQFRDEDGYTALHRASYMNHPKVAQILLKAGADIAASTEEEKWQPVHSACRWNSADALEVLLSWGADVNARTHGGQTPLHLAAFCGNSRKTLELLLSHSKIKSMTKNSQNDSPKDIALRNGNCVELFDLVQPAYRDTTT